MPSISIGAPLRRAAARARAIDRPIYLLAGMAFIVHGGVSVMLPLLPLYAQTLGATPFVLGLMVSGFAVMLAVGQLASGFLTERFAARRLTVAGLGTYAAANIGIAASGSAFLLVAYRGVAGLGSGISQVAERLYLTQVADRTRLAFANGLLSAAGSAGSVMGPTIGGVLAATGDLRLPFIVVGFTSAAAAIAGWFLPPPPVRVETEADRQAADTARPGLAARIRSSITRVLVVLFVAQLAFQASFGAFITTYAPFATARLGWSTAEVGIVFSVFGLGSVLLGPWLARMADARGRRLFAVIGALLIVPFPLAYVAELPRLVLYPVSVLAGAGVTTFLASWYALLSDATDGGRRGRVFGTVVALSSLGIVVGSTIAAQIWERTTDVGVAFVASAVMVAIGAAALLGYPHDGPTHRQPDPATVPPTDEPALPPG